jgi:hypothetical protein
MLVILAALMLWLAPTGRALDIAAAVVVTEWVRVGVMSVKLSRILKIAIKDMALIAVCIVIIAISSGAMIQLMVYLIDSSFNVQTRLGAEIFAGGTGLLFGGLIVRYIAVHLSAIRFLAGRSRVFSKFLPKYSQLT